MEVIGLEQGVYVSAIAEELAGTELDRGIGVFSPCPGEAQRRPSGLENLEYLSPADRPELRARAPLYLPCRSYYQLGKPLARTLPKA